MRKLALLTLLVASAAFSQGYAPTPSTSASQFSVYNTATTGALTLYVDSTGSDANACTSSGASACLTIQGAINKIPKTVRHVVTVNIGAGNFAGAFISGFTVENGESTANGAYINLVGTLATVAAVDGVETGTFTAGSAGSGATWGTATMAGAGWTVNQLQGLMVEITGGTGAGQLRQIASNTATVITIPGTWSTAPDATSTFAIRDWSSIITTGVNLPKTSIAAEGSGTGGGIFIDNVTSGYQDAVVIDKLKFNIAAKKGINSYAKAETHVRWCSFATTTQNGIHGVNGAGFRVDDCTRGSGAAELVMVQSQGSGTRLTIQRSTAFGSLGLVSVGQGSYLVSFQNYAYNISGWAYDMTGGNPDSFISSDKVDCVSVGGSKQGINYGGSSNSLRASGTLSISSLDVSNCGVGINTRGGAIVFTGAVTGTGNTTGIQVLEGGQVKIASTATLTGTTEISIDGTSTDYATIRAAGPPKLASSTLGSRVWEP